MIKVRELVRSDFLAVQKIYQQGIDTGNATFQLVAKEWREWDSSTNQSCRLVAELNNEIVGWAALSPISSREVYSGVAEVSLYIHAHFRGESVGSLLLSDLVDKSEKRGFWTLQAGVFPENEASIRVHKKMGFKVVGIRERLGNLNGSWRDVTLLERRSNVVG